MPLNHFVTLGRSGLRAGTFSGSGTTLNGVTAGVNPLAPVNESDRC